MAEFIWFFGASGAGKATLIEKIAEGQFQIPDVLGELVVCRESLEWGRAQRKQSLEEQLGKYTLLESRVLIKGQSSDLTDFRTPYNLKNKMPELKQRIVLIYTKPELLPRRTTHRKDDYWPRPNHDFSAETAGQIEWTYELCKALNTNPTIIDNSGVEPRIINGKELIDLQDKKR